MFSGKNIYNFGIAELLRALRYPIFTGEVVAGNYIYSKKLLLHREMQGEFNLQSVTYSCTYPDSSSGSRRW